MTQDQLDETARARIGVTLNDKWQLDALLGVGGTASVYSASHRNGKRVAIKVLHPELSAHMHFRERFLREAYVGNHIEHPGAVTVYDDDVTEDGCAFLVMDLLEGENLEVRRERKGGVLEPLEVLSLVDDVLDTLQAAHAKGVIHRDIKPENLFLTHENTVRLLDFGIARINVPENPGQTLAGVSMGTPAFMPPEQASAHWDKVDAQSDLWAIGASMFTLLTGRYVHQGGTVNESLVLAVTKAAPRIENIDPSLPPQLARIVNKALERDKGDRYKSAAEMQFDVRMAYRELQGDVSEDERYSMSDGRLALHSAPPGPVYYRHSLPDIGSITGEPVSTDSDAQLLAVRGDDNKRLLWIAVGGVTAVTLLFALLANIDDPAPLEITSAPASRAKAAVSAEDETWERLREEVSAQAERARKEALGNALADAGLRGADEAEAEEVDDGARGESLGRSGARFPAASRGAPTRRSPASSPEEPPAQPAADEFDPFAKRH